MSDFLKLATDYQHALTKQILPFWLKSSRDERCGGYFDYLSALGEVIESDKSIATQAQQTAFFAWLSKHADNQPSYLEHARHGGAFLSQFAQDASFNCYAEVDRRGRAVAPSVDNLPACHVTIAYANLYFATDEADWASRAVQTFGALCKRRGEVREQQRCVGEFRQVNHLGGAVAFLQTILAVYPLLDDEWAKELAEMARHELLYEFLDRRTNRLREFVLPGGGFLNTPEGRRQNVGLTFRAVSVLLDLCTKSDLTKSGASRTANQKMITQVTNWALQVCDLAWNESAGGLGQYVDFKNQPLVFPTAPQKWAWVQTEAVLALAKCYQQTQQPACLTWLKRVHKFIFQHFPDLNYGAWLIALDEANQPILSLKAVPAAELFRVSKCLTEVSSVLITCNEQPDLSAPIK